MSNPFSPSTAAAAVPASAWASFPAPATAPIAITSNPAIGSSPAAGSASADDAWGANGLGLGLGLSVAHPASGGVAVGGAGAAAGSSGLGELQAAEWESDEEAEEAAFATAAAHSAAFTPIAYAGGSATPSAAAAASSFFPSLVHTGSGGGSGDTASRVAAGAASSVTTALLSSQHQQLQPPKQKQPKQAEPVFTIEMLMQQQQLQQQLQQQNMFASPNSQSHSINSGGGGAGVVIAAPAPDRARARPSLLQQRLGGAGRGQWLRHNLLLLVAIAALVTVSTVAGVMAFRVGGLTFGALPGTVGNATAPDAAVVAAAAAAARSTTAPVTDKKANTTTNNNNNNNKAGADSSKANSKDDKGAAASSSQQGKATANTQPAQPKPQIPRNNANTGSKDTTTKPGTGGRTSENKNSDITAKTKTDPATKPDATAAGAGKLAAVGTAAAAAAATPALPRPKWLVPPAQALAAGLPLSALPYPLPTVNATSSAQAEYPALFTHPSLPHAVPLSSGAGASASGNGNGVGSVADSTLQALWALASTPFYLPYLSPELDPIPLPRLSSPPHTGSGSASEADSVSPLLLRRALIREAATRAAKLYLLYGYGRDESHPVGTYNNNNNGNAGPASIAQPQPSARAATAAGATNPVDVLLSGVATVASSGAANAAPKGFAARATFVTGNDRWNGLAATAVDAIDTLMIMQTTTTATITTTPHLGLGATAAATANATAAVQRALSKHVAEPDIPAIMRPIVASLDFAAPDKVISFFEIGIRVLGGLISAHDLSGDRLYLAQAYSLARRMVKGFFGTTAGVPRHALHLASGAATNPGWTGSLSILAEVGTYQIEAASLAGLLANAYAGDASSSAQVATSASASANLTVTVADAARRAAALIYAPARGVFTQLSRYKAGMADPTAPATATALPGVNAASASAAASETDSIVAAALREAGAVASTLLAQRALLSGAAPDKSSAAAMTAKSEQHWNPQFWLSLMTDKTGAASNNSDWYLATLLTPALIDHHRWSLASRNNYNSGSSGNSNAAPAIEAELGALATAVTAVSDVANAAAASLLGVPSPAAAGGAITARRAARAARAARSATAAAAAGAAATDASNAESGVPAGADVMRVLAASRLLTVTSALAELARGTRLQLSPWAQAVREASRADSISDGNSASANANAKSSGSGTGSAALSRIASAVSGGASGSALLSSDSVSSATTALRPAGLVTVYVDPNTQQERGPRTSPSAALALAAPTVAAVATAITETGNDTSYWGLGVSPRQLSQFSAAAAVAAAANAATSSAGASGGLALTADHVRVAVSQVAGAYSDPYSIEPPRAHSKAQALPSASNAHWTQGDGVPNKDQRRAFAKNTVDTAMTKVREEVAARNSNINTDSGSTSTAQLEVGSSSSESTAGKAGRDLDSVLRRIRAPPPLPLLRPQSGIRVSMGSLSDSYFEYLLKLYLLSGGRDTVALDLYMDAMDAMEREMVAVRNIKVPLKTAREIGVAHMGETVIESRPGASSGSANSNSHNSKGADNADDDAVVIIPVAFIGDLTSPSPSTPNFTPVMEHLTCFMGGLLALGAWAGTSAGAPHTTEDITLHSGGGNATSGIRLTRALPPSAPLLRLRLAASRHMVLATQVTNMCYLSYALSGTGLGPESITMLDPYGHAEPAASAATAVPPAGADDGWGAGSAFGSGAETSAARSGAFAQARAQAGAGLSAAGPNSGGGGGGGGGRGQRGNVFHDSPRDGWDSSETRVALSDLSKRLKLELGTLNIDASKAASDPDYAYAAASSADAANRGGIPTELSPMQRRALISSAATVPVGGSGAAHSHPLSPAALGLWPFGAPYFGDDTCQPVKAANGNGNSNLTLPYCYSYSIGGPAPGYTRAHRYDRLGADRNTSPAPAVYPYLPPVTASTGAASVASATDRFSPAVATAVPAQSLASAASAVAQYGEFACGRFCGHLPRSTYARWSALRQLEDAETLLDVADVVGAGLLAETAALGSFLTAADGKSAPTKPAAAASAPGTGDIEGYWCPDTALASDAQARLSAAAHYWQGAPRGGLAPALGGNANSDGNATSGGTVRTGSLAQMSSLLPSVLPATLPPPLLAALGRGPSAALASSVAASASAGAAGASYSAVTESQTGSRSGQRRLSSDPSEWPWPTSVGSAQSLVSSAARLAAMSAAILPDGGAARADSADDESAGASSAAAVGATPVEGGADFSFASLPEAQTLFPHHSPNLHLFHRHALSSGTLPRCSASANASAGAGSRARYCAAPVSADAGSGLQTGISASGHRWLSASPAAALRAPPAFALPTVTAAAARVRGTYLARARSPWAFAPTGPWSALFAAKETKYLLRPETIESVYLMYRVTGDERYRNMGWRIFLAIEGNCRTRYAHSSIYRIKHTQ